MAEKTHKNTELCAAEMRLAVVIVNYRSASLVTEALPVLARELEGFAAARVIIVDNASPGDDADVLGAAAARFSNLAHVVRSPVNGGFAAGNNVGFAALCAEGFSFDAVLLLNPDAEPRPGALAAMARTLSAQPDAGVVGARLENPDGTTWSAAFPFPTAAREFAQATNLSTLRRIWPTVLPDMLAPARVDWVSGAAMMVRSDALDALGGMDEGYFLYYEEVDFMRRLATAGWTTWHAPDALVRHTPGSSTGIVGGQPRHGRMPGYWFVSWRRYFTCNHGLVYARFAAFAKFTGLLLRAAQMRLRGRDMGLAEGFIADFGRVCLIGIPPRKL